MKVAEIWRCPEASAITRQPGKAAEKIYGVIKDFPGQKKNAFSKPLAPKNV
jgi:hypothetical protein